ncbi:MAG: hypothetical protein R2879_15595 [Saprospiraceae bacterium]
MKINYSFVLFVFLGFALNGQNSFLTPQSYRAGLYFGTESYFQETASSLPDMVKLKPDFLFPINQDNKAFGGFFELETKKNWVLRANLGYTELNDYVWVNRNEDFLGNFYAGGKTASDLNAGLQFGYNFKWKNFEIMPYVGLSGNFGFGNATTYNSAFSTNGVLVENLTTIEKSNFVTIDIGLRIRYWIKNFGIEFSSGYSHGFGGLSNSGGTFNIDGQSGTFSGSRSGSKFHMNLGVLYRFGGKKE